MVLRFIYLILNGGQSEANGYDSSVPAYNISMDSGGCYNPTTNNTGNYLAGCTAVAMGQILRYWKFSYGPYAEYDWWFMSDALYTNSSNFTRNRLAISSMLKNIGERVDASYGCGGTSTINTISKAKTAFKALGYVEDDMDHKYKSLHSYSGWVSLLREEVEANRPILYTTQTHSLVCDGYNYENGDLHFNLGWNNYNVFVDFEDLPVSGGVIYHECLIGINPNWITHLAVQNNTVISEYLTGDPLSITYQAKKITLAGNNSTFTIMPEANLRLLASDTITLLPGFWAKSGSSMLAKHFANTEGTLKSENISNTSFLSDNEDSKYVILSPNPSYDGPFYINAINDKKDSESIGSVYSIINSQGTILYEGRVFQDILDIDLGNYPKGIYYLKLTINNNVVTYKLLSL